MIRVLTQQLNTLSDYAQTHLSVFDSTPEVTEAFGVVNTSFTHGYVGDTEEIHICYRRIHQQQRKVAQGNLLKEEGLEHLIVTRLGGLVIAAERKLDERMQPQTNEPWNILRDDEKKYLPTILATLQKPQQEVA
ncbi:MAG TPA: hypothetical protein VJB87_01545 [Candidatus Nanoarchaeia archaeon]|nr:hypothetical protein [Candidatus Nanoarchaeia archaeon]